MECARCGERFAAKFAVRIMPSGQEELLDSLSISDTDSAGRVRWVTFRLYRAHSKTHGIAPVELCLGCCSQLSDVIWRFVDLPGGVM